MPYPEIDRLTPAQAQAAVQSSQAVIIDVRAVEAYNANRIAGSLSYPESELLANLGKLDPNQWIITYCT